MYRVRRVRSCRDDFVWKGGFIGEVMGNGVDNGVGCQNMIGR